MEAGVKHQSAKFELGQRVWFALDAERHGIVSGIKFCIDDTVIYSVVWNDFEQRSHYAFELAAEKPAVAV